MSHRDRLTRRYCRAVEIWLAEAKASSDPVMRKLYVAFARCAHRSWLREQRRGAPRRKPVSV